MRRALLLALGLAAIAAVAAADTLYIDVQSGGDGTVAPSGVIAVERGASQSFTFAPNGCSVVSDVQVDNVSVGAPLSFTFSNVQADHALYVGFGPPASMTTLAVYPLVGKCTRPDTLVATVSGAATGQVEFFEGMDRLGAAPLTAGVATLVLTRPLAIGTHTLDARFAGSSCLEASSSVPFDYVVQPGTSDPVTLELYVAQSSPQLLEDEVVLSAGLKINGVTAAWASGTVQFYDGPVLIHTYPMSQGSATTPHTFSAPGTHVLSARYLGSDCFGAAQSGEVLSIVKQVPVWTFAGNPNPSQPGQTVTIRASEVSGLPTGSVTFRNFTTNGFMGTAVLVNGVAELSHAFGQGGNFIIGVDYPGDSLFFAKSEGFYQYVYVPVSITMAASSQALTPSQTVTLTASFSPASASGDVSFLDGGVLIAYGSTINGTAQITAGPLAIGSHSITAHIAGFPGWGSATSAPVIVQVDAPTAATIALFEAEPIEGGVRVSWSLAHAEGVAGLALERAPSAEGPWASVDAAWTQAGDLTTAADATAAAGQRYYYRLIGTTATGERSVFGPIEGVAGAPQRFALVSVWPNPSQGLVSMQLSLPRAAAVKLSVIDAQGREVAVLANGEFDAGVHTLRWDARSDGARAPAGLYFLRYATPEQVFVQRVAITQ